MIRRPLGLPTRLAALDRTAVMGVLNVTPDSFSDGGSFLGVKAAIEHGIAMFAEGADIVDIGGESTRPGADRVPATEEAARVLPVVSGLVAAGVPVSIDTMRASTAAAAVAEGACIVNDVSGGLADAGMYSVVADAGVPFIAMHWRGHSDRMADFARYDDVVADVIAELLLRVDAAAEAGVRTGAIVLDPGLGFAKEAAHNWLLLRDLSRLVMLGYPVLIGASRKRFLGSLLRGESGEPRPLDERDSATDAVTALAALHQVWSVRVHDVRGSKDAVRVAAAWAGGGDPHE
jgi:dihydropteroate synthase